MRTMYDSIEPAAIPIDAPMVAGYINGSWGPDWKAHGEAYGWDAAAWARFPATTVKVRIAVNAQINDGHVLDVEQGDALPSEVPGWLTERRAAGVDPSVYCNLSNVDAIRAACYAANVAPPHFFLAHYDGVAQIPTGYVAKQYADQELIPGQPHYDLSVVADYWPGVDPLPVPVLTPPPLFSQSPDITIKVGEVGMVAAEWSYKQPDGTYREKPIIRKVDSRTPGRAIYTIRPQVDPESDPTEWVDGTPAIFVVTVTDLP